MGTDSEDDFDNLFEDLDLTSTKLGRTEAAKESRLFQKFWRISTRLIFGLKIPNRDVLGDAYEYLIGQFASGAGKKAGEFYTPQEVSKVLAKIVTTGKTKLKSVYDPTCGSGSLLLRVAREVKGSRQLLRAGIKPHDLQSGADEYDSARRSLSEIRYSAGRQFGASAAFRFTRRSDCCQSAVFGAVVGKSFAFGR